ncbi:divalent-cation tolerance protein CutA [Streptomyces triticagri]|uniref:Divalent-cation tolerance protein CutA n=1 Tax=Streptomyces triticagri TaxID=2293568 RepID=A0A372LYD5_9ACTN|nr:divalent-cation tolerance protein CutA [Streptomyces triticagri]RFU83295.1 divalent-cation tolerance protein CutA [Streptomyces triticagri]
MSDELTVLSVLTTTDTEDKAAALARGAVESHLVACAQIVGPVTSVYRWEGAVETAREWQVVLKTTSSRYPELEEWIIRTHDYDVPEILATPVTGSPDYLAWVHRECTQ